MSYIITLDDSVAEAKWRRSSHEWIEYHPGESADADIPLLFFNEVKFSDNCVCVEWTADSEAAMEFDTLSNAAMRLEREIECAQVTDILTILDDAGKVVVRSNGILKQ